MIESILTPVMVLFVIMFVLFGITIYVASKIYDLKSYSTHQGLKYSITDYKALRFSLVIETHNSEKDLLNTLESIKYVNLFKLDTVIIDYSSKDNTKKIISTYIRENKKLRIQLISKRTNTGSNKILYSAIKSHAKSAYILKLHPGILIDENTLADSINLFKSNKQLKFFRPSIKNLQKQTLSSLFSSYLNLISEHYIKFKSLIGIPDVSNIIVYKKSYLLKQLKSNQKYNPNINIKYQSKVKVYTDVPRSIFSLIIFQINNYFKNVKIASGNPKSWPIAFILISAVLFLPVLLSYIIYLAISLHEPSLLLLALGLLFIYLLVSIWGEDSYSFSDKLSYSLYVPATFGLFLLLIMSQLIAMLKPVLWPYFLSPEYLRLNSTPKV